MNDLDTSAFLALFKEAYQKCFGHPMTNSLSETESKLISTKIFDQTGLVIGAKSIKNYSVFINGDTNNKEENPSVATLDTLARYVLDAPYTDEIQRKNKESHYPYWFQYKEHFHRSLQKPVTKKRFSAIILFGTTAILVALIIILFQPGKEKTTPFTEDFHSVSADSLLSHGWFVQSKDTEYWNRRGEKAEYLSLFTLKGDNWPDSLNKPRIRNMLLRKNSSDCFTTEIHLAGFVPKQNWQQAGILLLEDTSFTGKSLRLSFVYNDFYGGFPKSREVIVQAIISKGKGSDKPEEITHQLIFKLDSANEDLVRKNLQHSALRIEKQGVKFRLLYANGSMPNSAFKEIISGEVDMNPRFIGLFALKGFVDSTANMPARFDYFGYTPEKCKK